MRTSTLHKKIKSKRKRFPLLFVINFLIIAAIIFFYCISYISSRISISFLILVVILEFFISYKTIRASSFWNYIITIFIEKRCGKKYPNWNAIGGITPLVLPLLTPYLTPNQYPEKTSNADTLPQTNIIQLENKLYIKQEDIKKLTEDNLNQKNINYIFKINKKYLTQDLLDKHELLKITSAVFHLVFNYNTNQILELSYYHFYKWPHLQEFCNKKLNIYNKYEIEVLISLFKCYNYYYSDSRKNLQGIAEDYLNTIREYDIYLKSYSDANIYSKRDFYLKKFKSEGVFYLLYNMLEDVEDLEDITNLMPKEYECTLSYSREAISSYTTKSKAILDITSQFENDNPELANPIDDIIIKIRKYFKVHDDCYKNLKNYIMDTFAIDIDSYHI